MVVAADPADPAGDEVGVARVLAFHEDAVAPEDRRGAMTLGNLPIGEVDLGVDTQAAHDPGDRVPRHLDQLALVGGAFLSGRVAVAIVQLLCPHGLRMRWGDIQWSARDAGAAISAPC